MQAGELIELITSGEARVPLCEIIGWGETIYSIDIVSALYGKENRKK